MTELGNETAMPARATSREWIGLAVLTLAALVYAMDLTVLNLAIPRISAEPRPTSVPGHTLLLSDAASVN